MLSMHFLGEDRSVIHHCDHVDILLFSKHLVKDGDFICTYLSYAYKAVSMIKIQLSTQQE